MVKHESGMTSSSISAIMPVYNGVDFIEKSLPPLVEMYRRGEIHEVIVVDDGSTDHTVSMAEGLGARVVYSGGRLGPGGARNHAAELAEGDILWFVDADVVVHPDAAVALQAGFESNEVVAVFGSYDDTPPADNFFSQYKNLVHHYYHQRAREEARTFWSGCGAVRRERFLAVGGFDVEKYKYPSIEDIELGHRLISARGRVRLRRDVQCTHLKVWRFGNLVHTEIFRRAIPWSRLILTSSGMPDDLNTGPAEQIRAVLAGVLLISLLLAVPGILPWWTPIVALGVVAAVNREIVVLFYRRRGFWFACGALLFHQIYYLYSAGAFLFVVLEQAVLKLRSGGTSSA